LCVCVCSFMPAFFYHAPIVSLNTCLCGLLCTVVPYLTIFHCFSLLSLVLIYVSALSCIILLAQHSTFDRLSLPLFCLVAIKEKYSDWTDFLIQDLTGSRTAPANLLEGVSTVSVGVWQGERDGENEGERSWDCVCVGDTQCINHQHVSSFSWSVELCMSSWSFTPDNTSSLSKRGYHTWSAVKELIPLDLFHIVLSLQPEFKMDYIDFCSQPSTHTTPTMTRGK
jgi:hypothetical protein